MTKITINYNLPDGQGYIHIKSETAYDATYTLQAILKEKPFLQEGLAIMAPVATPAYKWDPAPEAEKIRLDDEDIPS